MAADSTRSDLTIRLLARSLRQRLNARHGDSYITEIVSRMSDSELVEAHDHHHAQQQSYLRDGEQG